MINVFNIIMNYKITNCFVFGFFVKISVYVVRVYPVLLCYYGKNNTRCVYSGAWICIYARVRITEF